MAGVADNAVSSAGFRGGAGRRIDSIESIRYCVPHGPHSSNDRGAPAHPARRRAPGRGLDVDGIPGLQRQGSGRHGHRRAGAHRRDRPGLRRPRPARVVAAAGPGRHGGGGRRGAAALRLPRPVRAGRARRPGRGARRRGPVDAARGAAGRGPRAGRGPARDPGRRRGRLPAVRRPRQPGASTTCWPAACPLVGSRRPGAPAGRPRAHRRGRRDAAHDPARARPRPHPGRPPVDAAHDPARAGPGPPPGGSPSRTSRRPPTPTPPGGSRGFRSLAGDDAPVVQAHDLTVEAGEAAARLLLDVPAHRRPTAVVAQADLLAAGVVRAAEALGLRVPQDLTRHRLRRRRPALARPRAHHRRAARQRPRAGRWAGSCASRWRAAQITDEPFPVRLRVGTTSSSPPSVPAESRLSSRRSCCPGGRARRSRRPTRCARGLGALAGGTGGCGRAAARVQVERARDVVEHVHAARLDVQVVGACGARRVLPQRCICRHARRVVGHVVAGDVDDDVHLAGADVLDAEPPGRVSLVPGRDHRHVRRDGALDVVDGRDAAGCGADTARPRREVARGRPAFTAVMVTA